VANSKAGINYAQHLRDIRPYVNFDYDLRKPLSSAAKAQISRYYGYIQKLAVREHQVYRSRNLDNLRAVQRFAQHDPKRFPRLTVAFVPNNGKERMQLRIDAQGRVHGKTSSIAQVEVPFDPLELMAAHEAGKAREYIEAAIVAAVPAKRYVVMAGEFEVPSARPRNIIADYVVDLMGRYSQGEDDKNSHHYKNWMFGLIGYNFHAQAQLDEYRADKRRATKERARDRVNQNKREKRIAEHPPGFWLNDGLLKAKLARPPQPKGWRQVRHREYFTAVLTQGYKEIKDRTAR
jgi:hypothetical protein